MRRITSALAVVALAGALVVAGALPASAVEPLPPAVTPLPDVTSRAVKSVTGSPMGDAWILQMRAQAAYRASGVPVPGKELVHVPKPITAPATIGRTVTAGQTGGVLGVAFMGGWAITDGVLALYGAATGDDPLGAACSQAEWVQAAVSTLYMFSAPDCSAVAIRPNEGTEVGWSAITYPGATPPQYLGSYYQPSNDNTWHCLSASGTVGAPTGYRFYLENAYDPANPLATIGNWSASQNTACKTIGATGSGYAGTSGDHGRLPMVLVRSADAVVVAREEELPSDPPRNADCKASWPDGSVTTSSTVYSYTEGGGINPRSISNLCQEAFVSKPGAGPDLLPTEIEVGTTIPGAGREIASKQPVPEFTPDEKKGLTTSGNGRGLVLQKLVGTQLQSCMTWEADCAGWWSDSSNGTNADTYRCTFDGSPIDLIQCGPYRHTFDTRTGTPTVTDPTTGQPQPWPSPQVNAGPGTAIGSQTGGGACAPGGFSLNPVDWVMTPLKCLFIPSQASVNNFTASIQGAADSTIIGSVARGASSLLGAFESGVGCGGLPIHLEAFGTVIVHAFLLESCTEPAAGVAATVKVVLTVGIVGAAFLAMIRYLAGIFGYGGLGSLMDNNDKHGGVKFD